MGCVKRWEDASDREIATYALILALMVSGGVLVGPVFDALRNGFSWSPWLLAYALVAAALGALAFLREQAGCPLRAPSPSA